ncbi:MAG: T9SS type A sorting domain-containing protein, partial [Ignavibacteriaceae bacterium]|nr:T9SS type A sorting domain-containing protein [Ignavibacteriaceae bacterium]
DIVENKLGLDWVGIGERNPDGLGVLPGTILRDSTPDMGAYEYVPRGPDITPPEVTGATLLDSVTLKIMFSELLDETTAEDENNYSISNNIDIFNASLSGSEVTLQTSTHSPGSYIVTVVNVEDLAGNPIAQSNTAGYSLIPPDSLIFLPIENVQGVIQEPGHTPLKTIDGLGALSGDPDSRWAAQPMPEELIFDLGSNRTVCKTRLSFNNWNYGRIYSYSILISSDNNNWVTIVSQATSASNEEWTIDEFPAVDARYVKVLFINNNQNDWAGLWEGEIWGLIPSVADPVNNGLPDEFSLHQNYPNPFNPSTTIGFGIPKESNVNLSIYNMLGELVLTLANEQKKPGYYEYKFEASNLASGIYLYRINAGSFVKTRKMILLR